MRKGKTNVIKTKFLKKNYNKLKANIKLTKIKKERN